MNNWDFDTDVVVVGYGASGGVAGVTAYDDGSSVIILEKSSHPGGCSILAGGAIFSVQNLENAIKYLSILSGGRVPVEVIQSFAQGLARNPGLINKLAQVNNATIKIEPQNGLYPLSDSNSAFAAIWVTKINNFQGFNNVVSTRKNGQMMFKLVMDNVEIRKIPVLTSTRAVELLTNNQGTIIGVKAEQNKKEIMIKAKKGVILACGGFEQNEWMRSQFLQGKPFYSIAPMTHTGDGILMAQKVGAALWHMWHLHGSYGFKFPEYNLAFRVNFAGPRLPNRKIPWIVVDKYFKRYMNEYPPAPQDTCHRPMELFDADLVDYPRIPSFMIFDEKGMKRPLAQPLGFSDECDYTWSQDNSKELERGWIITDNSIMGLGEKIKSTQLGSKDSDPWLLERTVREWNENVEKGTDPLMRPAGSMMAISSPPFYAIPVWPIISNTQGGPVHNSQRQIVDSLGKPIPRLYSAGELGSFFGHLYELGGNLGECFASGYTAGMNCSNNH